MYLGLVGLIIVILNCMLPITVLPCVLKYEPLNALDIEVINKELL